MASLDTLRTIERPAFFNGQRLFAQDLQDIEAFNRELRWQHNISLHQAGIARGLAVSGHKGDRSVTVQPGYALDALGREIILTQARVEPVPPVAGTLTGEPIAYDLTIAYPDDLEAIEERRGICLPGEAVRLSEEPVFCWVRDDPTTAIELTQSIKDGLRLVLARVQVLSCKLAADVNLDLAHRRSARPSARPYMACGRASGLTWTIDPTGSPITQATVDTSTGRFSSTPSYVVRVDANRPIHVAAGPVIDGPPSVLQAAQDQITVQLVFIRLASPGTAVSLVSGDMTLLSNALGVTWMGIEG